MWSQWTTYVEALDQEGREKTCTVKNVKIPDAHRMKLNTTRLNAIEFVGRFLSKIHQGKSIIQIEFPNYEFNLLNLLVQLLQYCRFGTRFILNRPQLKASRLGISGLEIKPTNIFASAEFKEIALMMAVNAIAILQLMNYLMPVNLNRFVISPLPPINLSSPCYQMISGYITDKNLLPITNLNFGRTHLPNASGRFEIGALECSGNRATASTTD